MKKFPNLEKLHLSDANGGGMLDAKNYTAPTVSCLNEFFIYLFNIKTSSFVYSILIDQYTAGVVVDGFFDYVLNQKLLKTFKHLELHLDILFHLADPSVESNQSVDYATYILPQNNYHGNVRQCKIQVMYKLFLASSTQPLLQLLQNMGNKVIDCLVFGYTEIMTDMDNLEFVPFSFDTIFGYCTHVKSLQLSYMTKISPPTNVVSSLESLIFDRCRLSQDIFSGISENCPQMKSLEISSKWCMGDIMDEVLKDVLGRNFLINMPSTRLRQLCLNISVEEFEANRQYHRVFVKYKTANKETQFCKSILQNNDLFEFDFDESCCETDYEMCLDDEKCVVFNIFCEAISNLIVNIKVGQWKDDKRIEETFTWKKSWN